MAGAVVHHDRGNDGNSGGIVRCGELVADYGSALRAQVQLSEQVGWPS